MGCSRVMIPIKKRILWVKNNYVPGDYIEWDIMFALVGKLYRDKEDIVCLCCLVVALLGEYKTF